MRWASHGIPLGTRSRVAQTLAGLRHVGITKFHVQHLDLSDLSGIAEAFAALRG
jgi:hypothetical protein